MADVDARLEARRRYFQIGEFNRAGELASASTRILPMCELERSLTMREEIRHLEGLSETLCTMAMVHHAAGRDDQALDCATRGMSLAAEQRNGGAVCVVRARMTLGFILLQLHRLPDALKELDAHAVAQRTGLLPELTRTSYYLALLRREAGDRAEASTLAAEAVELAARAYPALSTACQQLSDSLHAPGEGPATGLH